MPQLAQFVANRAARIVKVETVIRASRIRIWISVSCSGEGSLWNRDDLDILGVDRTPRNGSMRIEFFSNDLTVRGR